MRKTCGSRSITHPIYSTISPVTRQCRRCRPRVDGRPRRVTRQGDPDRMPISRTPNAAAPGPHLAGGRRPRDATPPSSSIDGGTPAPVGVGSGAMPAGPAARAASRMFLQRAVMIAVPWTLILLALVRHRVLGPDQPEPGADAACRRRTLLGVADRGPPALRHLDVDAAGLRRRGFLGVVVAVPVGFALGWYQECGASSTR